jgi:ubiquinone biosynthesis protein UbiJ
VNPFLQAVAQWLAALASGAIALDPVARARLARLSGRSIALEPQPPAEPVVLQFRGSRIEIADPRPASPSVVVRGSVAALLETFARGELGSSLVVEGDDVTLVEFTDVLRSLRPDVEAPLARLIGAAPAQNLVGFVEIGLATLSRAVRDLGAEGERRLRTGAAGRYLVASELDAFTARRRAAALHLDRLGARLARLEETRSGSS